MDYDSESNFMFTYPRQCSLDPRVCLVEIPEQILPEEEDNYVINGTSYTWNSVLIKVEGLRGQYDFIPRPTAQTLQYTVINNETDEYDFDIIVCY